VEKRLVQLEFGIRGDVRENGLYRCVTLEGESRQYQRIVTNLNVVGMQKQLVLELFDFMFARARRF
jgi:hypothetical protein